MESARPADDDYSFPKTLGSTEPRATNSRTRPADRTALCATPFIWTEPQQIPPRQWLYGRHLIRKYVSATIAPGGVGKSTLGTVDAIAMASGRQLLADKPRTPLRVWCWNGEDDADELKRRVVAAMLYHSVDPSEIADRLFLDSGRTTPIKIGTIKNGAILIARPDVQTLEEEIRRKQIDVLIIDPFVSVHSLPENANEAMDAVVKAFAGIADRTNCAIELVHHSRKLNGQDADIDSARGGSAIAAAVRAARILNVMNPDTAQKLDISSGDRRRHVRVDDAKANLAPAHDAKWIKLIGVYLGNSQPDIEGDWVATCEVWAPPETKEGVKTEDLLRVQQAIHGKKHRADSQAHAWVGYAVAEVLGLDCVTRSEKFRIKTIVNGWLRSGALNIAEIQDAKKGRDVKIIEVGEWANQP